MLLTSLFESASFSCITSGSPQPEIQWYKDGSPLTGERCSILFLERVSLLDRGFYYCTATSDDGVLTSRAAVLSINSIYQFFVPVVLPVPSSGPFQDVQLSVNELDSDALGVLIQFVEDLNARGEGVSVEDVNSSLVVYSIQQFDHPISLSAAE